MTAAMNADDPRFDAWLSRETGMDPATLGNNALARAVAERARVALGDARPPAGDGAIEAYWQLLNASADERLALIETLVVPETWFFRDREAFAALARLADARLVREPARALRVLSAPCSTGEEPYSIAMALLDAGIGPSRFSVDAIDISARAIERARDGLYGRNSFRGHPLEFRDRHFRETAGGWQLDARVQEPVRFVRASLFDLPLDADARYDFIFCRNVLIYFNRDAQDQSIRLLDQQLAAGGTIFVGPAETGLMMRHPLTPARIPLAFAFHRAPPGAAMPTTAGVAASDGKPPNAARTQPVQPARPATASFVAAARRSAAVHMPAPAAPAPVAHTRAALPDGHLPPRAAPAPSSANTTTTLDDARQLADTGRLDEAERTAHAFTIVHGPHADAFYLLGLIADARGLDADAQDFYRKTLYLEPAHYEALTHLAALRDAAGDADGARQLMARAQRASALRGAPTADLTNDRGGTDGSRRS
ncbi:methyltransferase [Burkholderia ubonensis]|nr:methyltransferase [Burkholderia ubonensis]KVA31302.1 methyltransferase [Burkholderia ubonensis]KVA51011.1 methyltransferase [Burkholderia ubonensis]